MERVHRTIDSYLRYAEHNQAAYRTIVSGGVGFDAEVHAIRDGVREAIVETIAEGAYGSREIAPLARMGLLGWLCSVEGATLDWIDHHELPRDIMRELLVKMLGGALRAIEELDPSYPAPGGRPPGADAPRGSGGPPAPAPPSAVRDELVDRLDQLAVRGVAAQLPEEGAAQALLRSCRPSSRRWSTGCRNSTSRCRTWRTRCRRPCRSPGTSS